MKRILVSVVTCFILAGIALAEKPASNISAHRHGNLADAQRLCVEAYEKINAAQRANEFDLGGHAHKAQELLEKVNKELKEAAEAANAR